MVSENNVFLAKWGTAFIVGTTEIKSDKIFFTVTNINYLLNSSDIPGTRSFSLPSASEDHWTWISPTAPSVFARRVVSRWVHYKGNEKASHSLLRSQSQDKAFVNKTINNEIISGTELADQFNDYFVSVRNSTHNSNAENSISSTSKTVFESHGYRRSILGIYEYEK